MMIENLGVRLQHRLSDQCNHYKSNVKLRNFRLVDWNKIKSLNISRGRCVSKLFYTNLCLTSTVIKFPNSASGTKPAYDVNCAVNGPHQDLDITRRYFLV